MTDQPTRSRVERRDLLPNMWAIFVTLWLAFIFPGPVATLLTTPVTPWPMPTALAWTVAFAASFLWLMLYKPFRDAELTTSERWVQIGVLALLTGLVLYIDLSYPVGWFWLFIYVVMAAGVVLPTRAAIGTIIAVTVLAAGIDVARMGWIVALSAAGITIWGVCTIMWRRLVVTVDELRAAREELARLAVAEERLRFARDLHDLLGHSLTLITLKSELAGRLLPADGERAAGEVADVERVARQALREVREAVAGYRRPTLAGELAGVRDLLAAAGIETRIDADTGPLPPELDAVLAWTIREGATNVIRHSGARHCQIRVIVEDGAVRAEVIDDGRGSPATEPAETSGSGLSGLAERVAAFGGRMTAGPDAGGGFRLQVELPLGSVAEPAMIPAGAGGAAKNGAGQR